MGSIRRFEDIEAWQRSRELARLVYTASDRGGFAKDFALRTQIRRAAISILSNIAEGFERDGNREFGQFLAIAKGSAGDVRAQLYVALDAGHLDETQFRQIYDKATEASRLLAGLMRYLGTSDQRGSKYRNDTST